MITVSGHSDDLIKVAGDIRQEISAEADVLAFSNGVVLRIEFTGVWRIELLEGHGLVEIVPCPADDEDNYSDVATIGGDVSWVAVVSELFRSPKSAHPHFENRVSDEEIDQSRYKAAVHAMQTGVAFMMLRDPNETAPKHLRVGVNSVLAGQAGLIALLISKGLITRGEYFAAIANTMEAERDRYASQLGPGVSLA